MRGKKTDPVFISQFIQESVQNGVETPDQIVQRAKRMIEQIDEEIKAVESKKIIRSKLLDVIASFEKQAKDKTEDAKLLPLFNVEYPDRCKEICELLLYYGNSIPIDSWATHAEQVNGNATTKYCYKQLLERNVLARKKDVLVRGERFDEYVRHVMGQDVTKRK